MINTLTLPSLETLLDGLPAAQSMGLSRREIERLFGYNGVAAAQVKRFARSHNCIVSHTDGVVVFSKLPPRL
jgi:hypothetical protein